MCIILCGDFQLNISPSFNGYQQNNINNRPAFKAIPRADYTALGTKARITIYELEKKDVPLLENFREFIEKFYEKFGIQDESRQVISDEAFRAGINILENGKKMEDKAKVLLSVSDEGPCGIAIGSALKKDKNGVTWYSSRKNSATDETELDFLTTWSKKYKGIGKMLLNEYLVDVKKDGFKSVYLRSELPECSFATTFYGGNGFRELNGNKQMLTLKKGDRDYVSGHYFHDDDLVIPMKATSARIDATIAKRSKELNRDVRKMPCSYDLAESIAIEPSGVKSCNIRPR